MGDRGTALKLFERAYECQRRGALDDAVRLYQASVAEHPTAEAHTFLGWAYALQRRFVAAIAECKRAIEVDPTFGNPYNDIGAYLVELGREDDAIPWGREDDAIPWFERALEATRYEARYFPFLNLARIHEGRGAVTEALEILTRAAEACPDTPAVLSALRRLQARVN
jgi:tetratricopeptide (TPR) repeat protein